MRRLLLFCLVLIPAVASAQSLGGGFIQYHPPASAGAIWDGGAFSSAATGPTGCTNPAFSFTADTNAGLCLVGANEVIVSPGAAAVVSMGRFRSTATAAELLVYDAGGAQAGVVVGPTSTALFGGNTTAFGVLTASSFTLGHTANDDPIIIDPVAKGANAFSGTITSADLTGDRTWTFPNSGGTVALVGGSYATVDDEDTPLTQRATLNFEGAGVTCADDTDQTTCTIPGGGAGSVDTSGTPVANDIAEFTDADTIQGRSYSEHATDMETALEAVLDLNQLQGQIADGQIADSAVDGGTGGEIADNSITPADIDETLDYSFTTLSGKQDRNNSAVNDDDCTGEQGLWWYDTTDSAFEFCDANSGAPTTLGAGSGYATVDDEDTPLTQRTTLNFEGAGVTCADDTDQTTCTIPGGGSSLPVADTTSIAEGSSDDTKEVRFEVDGITTGTVRVLTVPNADITLQGTPSAGTGISISCSNGTCTYSADSAVINHFTTGTGSPPGTCTAGKDVYVETDQLRACICSDTDTWSCTGKLRAHATDCTALTDGLTDEMCFERDANTLYVCEPSAGGCDTAGEWTSVAGGSGAPTDAKYIVAEANGTLSAEVAPSAADQVPVSDSTTAATWRTLPDCDDASGQRLNYDTTSNAFSCGTGLADYSTKALTESAATSITQVSVASGAGTGGRTTFSVVATDNTDWQSVSGIITFACVNKAGTEACTISASDVTQSAVGTLVCSYSVSTTPTNAIDLQLNCVSSLTQTSLNAYHKTQMLGPGTVTPQ